jgi:HAD superfamily hydrolase (TIGR01509 family)
MQAQVVEIAGLRPLVDSVCVSSVVGLRKPDPAIFRLAAEGLGKRMAGSWMVGDSPTHDIAGAGAAGLNTVWIARDREWQETDYRPTLVATSVA